MSNDVGVATSDRVVEEGAGQVALSFAGVSRAFPGVQALDEVSLEIVAGEVHAIVGENGAGKSTLMAIASGALAADAGTVTIAGTALSSASPTEARDLGLAICRQTPSLLGDLTVAENFAIAIAPDNRPRWERIGGWSKGLLDTWAQNRIIDPKTFARSLDPAARFMVEISKAISQQPKVLLLDEPTEALGIDETELLFGMIRELAAAGTAVVYISHRIPDVMRISDRISVLRDGVLRGTHQAGAVSEDDIVQAIVGAPLELAFPPKLAADAAGEPVLSVSGLHGDRFSGVDLEVRTGEIVGISGVEGNGQAELIRALAGLSSGIGAAGGEVRVAGKRLRLTSPARAQKAGIVYLPADRHEEGVWSGLGVRENITATTLGDLSVAGLMRGKREARVAGDRVRELDIKTSSLETMVGTLSGGNQQKAVIARARQSNPKIVLAHEPTQGVDVGSRLEIYRILRQQAATGAVVVVSSDAAELEGLCDRVLVMSRGTVVRELSGADVSEHSMTQAALTATRSDEAVRTERRQSGLRRFLTGDFAPPLGVLVVLLALGLYTTLKNDFYLTQYSIASMLALFAALAFAAMAQQTVMITGGIDLSVGPAMSFLVVVASFWLVPGIATGSLLLSLIGLVGIAAVIAVVNWTPTLLGVPAFVVTLVTFTALQGLALWLRPTAAGSFDEKLLTRLGATVGGWVPWAAIAAVVVGVALEVLLRRSPWGAQVRAVGSNPVAAHEAGVAVPLVRLGANLLAGLLVVIASLLLTVQVGAGDPTVGISYTLSGITAAVVGGASIFGGRGSMLGALAGALLIQQINVTTVFLGLDVAWQSYLLGGLTVVAAGFYSIARGGNRRVR